MSARTAPSPRVLTVRRPLVRPGGEATRLLRAMRGAPMRHLIVLGTVLMLLCILHVWLRLQVLHVGYELSAAHDMEQRLLHQQHELEVELATLRDPRRLADVARRRLGLVEPRSGQVLVLP